MWANVGQLNRAFMERATAAQMQWQCLGDGNINAELAIVSEAPGTREVEMKIPLVGGSGRFLWKNLEAFGIRRSQCYVTNVVKRQLVTAGADKKGISANERSHWFALLEWELKQLPKLKYVLVLGGLALNALLGHEGIDQWQGSVVSDAGITYVIAHNPANILRKPTLEPIFKLNCWKLDTVMKGQWKEHDVRAFYDPTPAEVVQWCDKMIQERKPVGFDIETIGNETACIGFANDAHEGMCINLRSRTGNRFSVGDERMVRRSINRVLNHAGVPLIAQNGGFDCGWLAYKDRISVRPLWMDTLLAHHTLYPAWPHNLGFLTAQYTTHPYYKDEKDEWREKDSDISTFWEYNVKDCCMLIAAATPLERELRAAKLWDFFRNHVMRLQPWLINMTVLGNNVDLATRDVIAEKLTAEIEELKLKFWDGVAASKQVVGYVGGEDDETKPNPQSPKQLGELLFRKLRLVGKTTSTDEANRETIKANPRTPNVVVDMLNTLDTLKEKQKFLSVYATMSPDEDNRLRSDYKQFGVASAPGRLSSAQTLWGSGGNLQNIPPAARGWFIADPGYVFVYFDGAQAEARIVGWEGKIDSWKHQFEQARLNPGTYDAHCALASEMFNVPYAEVPKDDMDDNNQPTIRYIAKRCRHGLNYRMQIAKLAQVLGVSMARASDLWHRYHRTTPELQRWWDTIINEVKTTRMLWSCKGRRMVFLGSTIDESLFDAVIAFKPQSALGDHVCEVMYRSQEDSRWPRDARIVFNNHDSLTAMCRPNDAKMVGSIMRQYAEQPMIIHGEPLIIPADCKISVPDEKGIHRWSNMKKLVL